MKIALLHYSAPPIVGGVESVLAQQAKLFAENGHQVTVIAGRGEKFHPAIDFILLPLIDSRHADVLEIKSSLDQGRVPVHFAGLVDKIYQELTAQIEPFDFLIVHNCCSLNKNLALTCALQRLSQSYIKPHFIAWHHDLAWATPRYAAELHPGYPWEILKQPWPDVTQVVISDLRQKELCRLMDLPLQQVRIIPNGIDLAEFYKLEKTTRDLLHHFNFYQAAPLMLLPVRITARKNIELALEILSALQIKQPQAQLIITGPLGAHNPANEKYFNRLKTLRSKLNLEGSAHFLTEIHPAYLSDAVIADFYRLADILLLPSREEGFGLPVLEAGLSRLPVFCSDLPPLQALAGNLATYFSPEEDPLRVAAQIEQKLHSNPSLNLCIHIRQNYTWEQVYRERICPLLETISCTMTN